VSKSATNCEYFCYRPLGIKTKGEVNVVSRFHYKFLSF